MNFSSQYTNAVKLVKKKVTQVLDTMSLSHAAHVTIYAKVTSDRKLSSLPTVANGLNFIFADYNFLYKFMEIVLPVS